VWTPWPPLVQSAAGVPAGVQLEVVARESDKDSGHSHNEPQLPPPLRHTSRSVDLVLRTVAEFAMSGQNPAGLDPSLRTATTLGCLVPRKVITLSWLGLYKRRPVQERLGLR
jgi:hypothetical protein